MRRMLTGLIALAIVALACDTITEPPITEPLVTDALVITGGNFQRARVTERLSNPLRVEARAAGVAVSGQLVCFVAATHGAGEPFTPCVLTDDDGVGETPWDLGTIAGDHEAQARAMVDGEPTVVATYVLEATPGPPASISGLPSRVVAWLGDTITLSPSATDAHGNTVSADSLSWSGASEDGTYTPALEAWDTITVTAGAVSRSAEMVAMRRIGVGWTYALRCEGGVPVESGDQVVDSLIAVAVVDTLISQGGDTPDPSRPVLTGLHATYSVGWYFADGTSFHRADIVRNYGLYQGPGSVRLKFSVGGGGGGTQAILEYDSVASVATDNPPAAYTGGSRCGTATTVEADLRAPDA